MKSNFLNKPIRFSSKFWRYVEVFLLVNYALIVIHLAFNISFSFRALMIFESIISLTVPLYLLVKIRKLKKIWLKIVLYIPVIIAVIFSIIALFFYSIIGFYDGEVKSFNGDGVLVVFYGGSKCNNAVRAALQMMDFVEHVLKAKLQNYFLRNRQLQNLNFSCGIGIDMGKVLLVKAGARGNSNNDLVWVGNPTNYAVKLSPPSERKTTDTEGRSRKVIYNIHITNRVYSKLKPDLKTIKTGFFPRAIWQKQPLGLGTFFTNTSSATVVYRTNQTLPF